MVLDVVDAPEHRSVDLAVDTGHVDINDADCHPGKPFAAVSADLLFKTALARKDGEGRPPVSVAHVRIGGHAPFTRATRDRIDYLCRSLAADMRQLIQ